jgi:TolB-like protein
MLGVLPFENLSGDPSQEYLNDGLTEETIMRLGQMSPRRLGVIARTSSMVFKQTDKLVAQIGRELGVDYVLEGSVRREGDRVRITTQLIRVQDQIHLWAETYDRQLPGVLDIHSEIGAAIAAHVKLKLMSEGTPLAILKRTIPICTGFITLRDTIFPTRKKPSDIFRLRPSAILRLG